jgi:hypothetical protein
MDARWIPYLTAAGAVLAAIALFFAIRSLIGRARLDALATLPIAPEHRLELPAGELVLHWADGSASAGSAICRSSWSMAPAASCRARRSSSARGARRPAGASCWRCAGSTWRPPARIA